MKMSVDTDHTQYHNERVSDVPLRILNRGPEYIRSRMMNRDSALFRHNRRSAVELLAESRPLYVKTDGADQVDGHRGENRNNKRSKGHHRRNTDTLTILEPGVEPSSAIRRSTSSPTPCNHHRGTHWGDTESHNNNNNKGLTVSLKPAASPDSHPRTALIGDGRVRHGPVPPPKPAPRTVSHPAGPPPVTSPPAVPPRVPMKPPQHVIQDRLRQRTPTNSAEAGRYTASPPASAAHPGVDKAIAATTHHATTTHHSATTTPDLKKRSKEIPTISTDHWLDTDTGSEKGSSFKLDESSTVVRRRHRKAISRSRSDLTKRFSNSSDFSELSSRLNRNSADLEKFFNEMGLEHGILEPLRLGQSAHAQSTASLNLLESVSCLGSTDARSCFSEESLRSDGRLKPHDNTDKPRTPGSTAIVERNARIIKWLCNIKVASTGSTPHLPQGQAGND